MIGTLMSLYSTITQRQIAEQNLLRISTMRMCQPIRPCFRGIHCGPMYDVFQKDRQLESLMWLNTFKYETLLAQEKRLQKLLDKDVKSTFSVFA